jgi:hypothetical protein
MADNAARMLKRAIEVCPPVTTAAIVTVVNHCHMVTCTAYTPGCIVIALKQYSLKDMGLHLC